MNCNHIYMHISKLEVLLIVAVAFIGGVSPVIQSTRRFPSSFQSFYLPHIPCLRCFGTSAKSTAFYELNTEIYVCCDHEGCNQTVPSDQVMLHRLCRYKCNAKYFMCIPYSAKFSRRTIFVNCRFQKFRGNNFRGPKI